MDSRIQIVWEERKVDVAISYRGPLPNARSDGAKRAKTQIRTQLHHQLDGLCRNSDLFTTALKDDLFKATIQSGAQRVELPPGARGTFYFVEFFGTQYVPLLSRHNHRVCELTVQLWRRADPGELLDPGGDIDNRVKTLFDGLRIPHGENEIDPSTAPPSGRCFCLLEDDALITKLTMSTHKMYRPISPGEDTTYAELSLYVTIKATFPSINNIPLNLV